MGYLDMISQIEVQVLKNLTYTPTDIQLVGMTQSYLKALITAAENNGELVYDAVQNDSLPITFLGVNVTWDKSNPEGDSFTLELNGITVTQDADDPAQEIGSGGGNNPPNNITGVKDGATLLTDWDPGTPDLFDIRWYYTGDKTFQLVVDNDSGTLDPDGDTVTFKSNPVLDGTGENSVFSLNETTGEITYTNDWSGSHEVIADFWTEDSEGATSEVFAIRLLAYIS